MDNRKHFWAWLRLARRLDWSAERHDATCVRAFAALQLAMRKCGRNGHDEGDEQNRPQRARISADF